MRLYKLLSLLVMLIFVFSCDKQTESNKERPLEHWVFRSVLDWQPRIITLALDKDLWAAYYTKTGAVYKVWKGSVLFDGPVYTTAHGPQPISIGDSYVVNKYKEPWFVLNNSGDTLQTSFQYKGHRFINGQVELMYAISHADWKSPITIYERVETEKSKNGNTTLLRRFTTSNVPEGIAVKQKLNLASIILESNVVTDGNLDITNKSEVAFENVNSLQLDGVLTLNNNGETNFDVSFMMKPTIPNENAGVEEEEEEKGNGILHEVLALIAKSDCKTCHNKNLKTIGPSYVEIAKKYKNTPDNISLLSSKIKNGGSGVWGNQQMTPHPDLDDADIKTMVEYIFSLQDPNDVIADEKSSINFSINPTTNIDENALIPGAMVSVYDIPSNTVKMPAIADKTKPKYAGILANFDNISGSDFKGLEDNFAIKAKGYLKIDSAGTYLFHIWSDDGSKVYIEDQMILDNDGLHGAEYKEAALTLNKGYYAFRIEYFQGSGGRFLSFNWKKPGKTDFEVISPFNIFHNYEMRGDLSGFSLPMSNISRIPGDQYPLQDVHPSFDLYQARPDDFQPKVGGMDFLSDGRLVVSTWDAAGSVYIVENTQSGDPSKMTYKRIAFGLAEPLGLKVVNDTIYVMQKQEMTRLVDVDKDDIIDEYQTLTDAWDVSSNFHEFGFGLEYKDGFFYATLATAINPGGASTQPQIQDRGKVLKVDKNTGKTEFIASGLRTPNGIGIGYKGELFVADNQGDWLPSSKIVHIKSGAWYGSRSVDFEGTKDKEETLPVVWLPQDEIGNSPSTPSYINVGPYAGQMIHGEVTHGGVKRVFVEEVEGQFQGCVFRFIQGLEAGVNRICWAPDGSLYIGGIGNPGNWGHSGKLGYGLQRLVFNDKPTFEMLAVRAKSNGIEIEFTEPLNPNSGWNPADFEIKQWYYKPTEEYGGPKLDEKRLKVKSATVSDDRKKVFLALDGMKDNHMIYVHLLKNFVSNNGNQLLSTEAWYTMNKIPKGVNGIEKASPYSFADNTLTQEEIAAGWKLLFNGKDVSSWRNFKKQTIGKSWIIQENAIHLDAQPNKDGHWQAADGGDIITNDAYENFEFMIDWKIANCGNSGIIFNIVEADKYDYVWQTGPEMQILDNTCHPDTKYVTHRAGDLYDLIESKYSAVKPAGQWNEVRIKKLNGKVEFWLNGHKTVDFEMHTEEWTKMIANSKFKDMPDFGLAKKGHISLQDHGDKVWFKNIKIRTL